MKLKIFIILILCFLLICIKEINIYSFSPRNEYLWIEFGKCIREKDGSLTLLLKLNYGRFPDAVKKELRGLDDIGVFYTMAKTDNEGKDVFYATQIKKGEQGYSININSSEENRFVVFAQAKKQNKITHQYLAKTSFFLFGHAFSKSKRMRPTPSSTHEINRQLEICTIPEFQYWPQTGNPFKIVLTFNKDYLAQKALSLFDENMPPIDIITDEKGECIYVPPEDKRLNKKGETPFKQTVIVAEEIHGDTKHISSCTLLLHRSRFKNYRFFEGTAIFLGTMAVVSLFVSCRKKED